MGFGVFQIHRQYRKSCVQAFAYATPEDIVKNNDNPQGSKANKHPNPDASDIQDQKESEAKKKFKFAFPHIKTDHIETLLALGVQSSDLLLACYVAGMCAYSKERIYKVRHAKTARDFDYSMTKIGATFKRLLDCGFLLIHSKPFGRSNRYILSENAIRAFLDPDYRTALLESRQSVNGENDAVPLPKEYVGLFFRDWKSAGAPASPTITVKSRALDKNTTSETTTKPKRKRGRPAKNKTAKPSKPNETTQYSF